MDYTFQDIKECATHIAKGLAVTGAIWLVYTLGFSYSWILLTVIAFCCRQLYVSKRKSRIATEQYIYKNEKEVINAHLSALPNWVFFPDVEKAEWINMVVMNVWPSVKDYCKQWMLETLQPLVASYLPSRFASFRFHTIYLGELPPRIGGVKVYDRLPKKSEIVIDVDIYYAGNARVDVSIGGAAAGIEDVQLRGTLRVVLKPLLDDLPFVGGLVIFFLQPPRIDYNLTQLGNLLDLPVLQGLVKGAIVNVVTKRMVAPHKMTFILSEKTDSMKLRQSVPDGVVRLEIVKAKDLAAKDHFIGKYGLSDPYAKIFCGQFSAKTRTIDNTLNPQWHESYEFIVDQKFGEVIRIDLWDEDVGKKHDALGNASLSIEDLAFRGYMDDWLTLENSPGSVHVTATWFTLTSNLNEVIKNLGTGDGKLDRCVLCVFVDSARNLQVQTSRQNSKKMAGASVSVGVIVGNDRRSTAPSYDMVNPQWRENFSFLVRRPVLEDVKFRVVDSRGGDQADLGTLVVPLKELLSAPSMATSGSYLLKDQGGQSELVLRLAVKVLRPPSKQTQELQPTADGAAASDAGPSAPSAPSGSIVGAAATAAAVQPQPKAPVRSMSRTSNQSAGQAPQLTHAASATAAAAAEDGMGDGVAVEPTDKQPAKLTPPGTPLGRAPNSSSSTPRGGGADAVSVSSHSNGGGLKRNDTFRMSEIRRRATVQTDLSQAIGGDVGLGKIQLTFRYSVQRSRIVVVIHNCIGLASQGPESALNLYVSITLVHALPIRGIQPEKKKTQIIKNSTSPIFDEPLELAVNQKDVSSSSVSITVKNKVSTFTKLNLGRLLVALADLDASQASTRWYNLQQ